MIGFVIAALIVGWFSLAIYIIDQAFKTENKLYWVVFVGWIVLGFGSVLQLALNEDNKGPCLKYEETMQYNFSTNSVMPARYCTVRAEWVEK